MHGLGAWAKRAGAIPPGIGPGGKAGKIPPGIGPRPTRQAVGAPVHQEMEMPEVEAGAAEMDEEAAAYWAYLKENEPEFAAAFEKLAEALEAVLSFNPKFDPEASEFVAEEMRTGKYPREQAVAIGLSRARKAGLNVPGGPE